MKRTFSLVIALIVFAVLIAGVAVWRVEAKKPDVQLIKESTSEVSPTFFAKLLERPRHTVFDYSLAPDELALTASLTPGNLVVCRVGSGAALNGTATAAFLDEFTAAGSLVQSIALPTSVSGGNQILTVGGTPSAECQLTRSADGRYIIVPGYNIAVGTAVSPGQRTIGRIDAAGVVDTTTVITSGFTSFRGATSSNGTDMWAVGSTTGVVYTTFGSSSAGTVVSTTITNNRVTNIFNGQLYSSDSSGAAVRLGTVGTGLPTTAGQTITNLPGFLTSTGSPYAFFFADLSSAVAGVDTLYVADDGGTILKYSLVGGTWTANGTIAAAAIRGLTGTVTGSSVRLFGTTGGTGAAGGGSLYTLVDNSGYNATITGSLSTIATAAANTVFRGVALAPTFKFRSIATGNWNANSTWEMSVDGVTWLPATATPTSSNADTITVRSPHTVTVTAAVNADQLTVDAGAILAVTSTLTNDGTTTINGSFQLNTGGVAAGNEFVYGANGTLIYNHTGPDYVVGFVDTAWPFSGGPFNVTLQNGGGVNLGDFRDVLGTLSLLNGTISTAFNLNMGNGATIVRRAAGGFAGGSPGFDTNVNVIYDGTVALTTNVEIPATSSILQNLTITNTGGVTLGANATTNASTSIAAGARLATGAFTFTNSGSATVNGSFQIDQGGFANGNNFSYDPVTATLIFNNSSGSFGVSGTPAYWPAASGPQNVTVQGSGGITTNVPRTVGLLFQYAAGVSNMVNLTLNGVSQVNTGGFTSGSPTYGATALLKYNTGGTYGRNGEWLPGATSGAGYPRHVQLSNNTTLDLPNGSSGFTFQMSGDLTIDSGSMMQLSGSTPLTQPLTIFGSLNNNGILNLSNSAGGDVNVGGNWNNNSTFNNNGRTVTFNSSIGQGISGNSNFFNLTKNSAVAQTLTFAAGSTQNVANLLTLNGASGNLLSLRSTVNGTQWKINAPGTQSVNFVDAKDSDASGGSVITPGSSVDSGNNINWTFAAADYTVTTSGPAIVVTDISNNGDTLTVSEPGGGQVKFAAPGRFFSVNGGAPISGDSGNLLIPTNSITIRAEGGNDIINIGAFATSLPSLGISGGAGDDAVNFTGNLTFDPIRDLSVDLQSDPTPGIDTVNFAAGANVVLSGTGPASVKVSKTITFATGSKLQVENGNLTLEANQQAPATLGDFTGVDLNGGTVQSTGSGNVNVKGKGGEGAFDLMYGVRVWNGGKILSTGTGTITVQGTGGARTGGAVAAVSELYGVYVYLVNSEIRSASAAITITGTGGATNDTGSYGFIVAGGKVQTSGAGTLTINGNGGTVTGGHPSPVDSAGVFVVQDDAVTPSAGLITSTGSGANAGNIIIIGISGPGGAGAAQGLRVDAPATVTSVDGSITLAGTGGACANACLGTSIRGAVTATGTGAINITGTGAITSNTASPVHGVNVRSGGIVTTNSGNLTITATAGSGATAPENNVAFDLAPSANPGSGILQTTGTGSISVNADSIFIRPNPSATITAGASVTLRSPSDLAIDLGSSSDPAGGPLGLSDGELDRITAGTINISDSNGGAITVSAPISRPAASNLVLRSNLNIDLNSSLNSNGGDVSLLPGSNTYPNNSGIDVTTSATKTLTLAAFKNLTISINTTTVDSGYTQLNVAGLVNLNNAQLALSGGYVPVGGESFIIVNNDSNDTISGTFNTLPQGATVTNFLGSGLNATISYTGGDGNDAVITVVAACTPPSTVYVDDDWAAVIPGTDPDGGGPATNFGCDSFATIQGGVGGVTTGGTVIVRAGTYNGPQLLINRSMTVTGAGAATTIINGLAAAPPTGGLVHIEPPLGDTGNVSFTGFTVTNPGTGGGGKFAMFVKPLDPATTVTISNNTLLGVNSGDTGMWAYRNRGSIVFDHNSVTNTGFNGLLIEEPLNSTNVHHNTISVAGTSSSYFAMTYESVDVTSLQRVADNTINGPLASAIVFNPSTVNVGAAFRFGKYTNVQITDNVVTNLGAGRSGIALLNDTTDPTGALGAVENPVITGNLVTGTNAATSNGIRFRGLVTNATIKSNDLRNSERGFFGEIVNTHSATGTEMHVNNVVGNTTGVVWNGPVSLNTENNWWGCNAGPGNAGCDNVTGIVDFNPWLVLGVSASPNPIGPGGTSTVTADMRFNSIAADTSATGTIPLTPATFSATQGSMAPPPTRTITAGQAQSTFTSSSATSGSACAMVDSQQICTPVTITPPSFAIDDVTHFEGNAGTTSYIFTVTKTGSTALSSSVDFTTQNGSATLADNDYQGNSGTLSFTATDITKQITVLVNGDVNLEPNEAFNVHLLTPVNATISDADGTGTITNDDVFCPTSFTVNNNGDAGDITPGDGVCATGTAVCTLRAAIQEANASSSSCGPIDINFSIPTSTITVASVLSINHSVNINGPVASSITVTGTAAVPTRVFQTNANTTVNISNLTVSGGRAAVGGGLMALGPNSTTTLNGMLFTGNIAVDPAGFAGGGGAASGNGGTLNIRNSTFSGNTGTHGGAISVQGSSPLNLVNVTITNNLADGNTGSGPCPTGGSVNGDGGGIQGSTMPPAFLNIRNSIVAFNQDCNADQPNITGLTIDQGNNITFNDPQLNLGPLQNNGGPTFTYSLQALSTAIDAGNDCVFTNTCVPALGVALTNDQRGPAFPRQVNGDTVPAAHVDIGAFEKQAPSAANSSISGRIVDGGGTPVEGVAIRLGGAQDRLTVTDKEGNYRFAEVATNGLYTVTPSRANFVFTPEDRTFTQLGEHTDALFTANSMPGEFLNPLDTTEYFVRQQYLDFLNREPDEAGLSFWVNNINACGADALCRSRKRTDTSAAFFLSIEFHETGYLVYRAYQSAYGEIPGAPVPLNLAEFRLDTAQIGEDLIVNAPDWQAKLEANKQAYFAAFVARSRFASAYASTLTPAEFVDRLFSNAGVTPSANDRAAVIAEFANAGNSSDLVARAHALRRVAENRELEQAKSNRAFVLMQYFGYLGRDPNALPDGNFAGYDFWLHKLEEFNGDFRRAEMVKAFLVAGEYRSRFPR